MQSYLSPLISEFTGFLLDNKNVRSYNLTTGSYATDQKKKDIVTLSASVM